MKYGTILFHLFMKKLLIANLMKIIWGSIFSVLVTHVRSVLAAFAFPSSLSSLLSSLLISETIVCSVDSCESPLKEDICFRDLFLLLRFRCLSFEAKSKMQPRKPRAAAEEEKIGMVRTTRMKRKQETPYERQSSVCLSFAYLSA